MGNGSMQNILRWANTNWNEKFALISMLISSEHLNENRDNEVVLLNCSLQLRVIE